MVIVGMQAEARNGMGDNPGPCESNVVGALKEALRGMRIRNQPGAVARKFRAKVGTLVSGEPKSEFANRRIGPADHFEFQVGHDRSERNRRAREETSISVPANLFRSKKCKHDRSA